MVNITFPTIALSQTLKVNIVGNFSGCSSSYLLLLLFTAVRSGAQTKLWSWTFRPKSLPVGLQPSLSSPSQDAIGRVSTWRMANLQLTVTLYCPRKTCWIDVSPQTAPHSSSFLTLSSYFSCYTREIPPSLTQNPCLCRTYPCLLW